jgi:acyl-homoserine lactone acylase PvdQ
MGDPVFDYFAKTELQSVSNPNNAQIITDSVVQLLDLIGQPVVLMVNSGVASSGWVVADSRPKLVKGILAAEPVAHLSRTRRGDRQVRDDFGA